MPGDILDMLYKEGEKKKTRLRYVEVNAISLCLFIHDLLLVVKPLNWSAVKFSIADMHSNISGYSELQIYWSLIGSNL
jgi:hypothetical protein